MFDHLAPTLIQNGFTVIPLKPREKRPALRQWQHARLSAADCTQWPGHGVGVLCGVGDPVRAIFHQ